MKKIVIFSVSILCMSSSALLQGQSGGDFEIERSTASEAGGGLSAGGDFELNGTIGQADAGELSGSNFTLTGGFWIKERIERTELIFQDGFE